MAQSTGGAMIGCTFQSRPKEDRSIHYAAANYGSGRALDLAVRQLSEHLGKPAFVDLPFLMYGYSAGGQFAYGYSCHDPRRLLGFVAVKGGIYIQEPLDETYQVPGLVISGELDLGKRRKAIRYLFEAHRNHDAPWCWMEERGQGHKEGECLFVAAPFLKSILGMRLNKNNKRIREDISSEGLWLDLANQKIFQKGHLNHDHLKTGWLPGADVFEKWKTLDNGAKKYETV
jgi:pimeloyl-ACP methyl ester carboxylesterase